MENGAASCVMGRDEIKQISGLFSSLLPYSFLPPAWGQGFHWGLLGPKFGEFLAGAKPQSFEALILKESR